MPAFFVQWRKFTPCTPSRGICGAHVGTGRLRGLLKVESDHLDKQPATMPALYKEGSLSSCKTGSTHTCLRSTCSNAQCGRYHLILLTYHNYPSQSIIPQGLLWTLNCRKWDMHIYFLAQVLASMIDKIERDGTTAIRRTKLSANSNIAGDKINNIPPMQIRTLFMLYLSFSSLVDVLYPAIKLSPLPVRIIVAKTKTINEIISSNINCAVILKDSDYLIRLALAQI